jgi:hypothetical protein
MDAESRKAEIRRRLRIGAFPRRSEARFTEENDHNPTVLQDCPRCYGSGKACEESAGCAELFLCPDCDGSGITGETEPYFSSSEPPIDAVPNRHGWLKCPKCGWRFLLTDPNAWTGKRHLKCGQKINPKPTL